MKIWWLLAIPGAILLLAVILWAGYAIWKLSSSSGGGGTGTSWNWKKITLSVVGIVLVFSLLGGVIYFVSKVSGMPSEASGQTAGGKIFAFILIAGVALAVIVWAFVEHGRRVDMAIQDNAVGTALGLLLLNAIAYLLFYESWRQFYDKGMLFWLTNICAVLFVFLIFKKGIALKFAAIVLAVMIITALLKPVVSKWKMPNIFSWVTNDDHKVYIDVFGQPIRMDVVMNAICEAESGCRQFQNGELVRNPKSSAVGKYGIMTSLHKAEAEALQKSTGKNYDFNTEEGNTNFARHLLKTKGIDPWMADPWSVMGWARVLNIDHHVWVTVGGEYSKKVNMIPGYNVTTVGTADPFIAMDDEGKLARFDMSKGINEDFKSADGTSDMSIKYMKFKSTREDGKPSRIFLRFWRTS